MLSRSRIFCKSTHYQLLVWKKNTSQFTNLNIFGGDITVSDVDRIWMLHLTGHWVDDIFWQIYSLHLCPLMKRMWSDVSSVLFWEKLEGKYLESAMTYEVAWFVAAAVSFVRAQAGVVIHTREKMTFAFGLLWAALSYPPTLTVAQAGLGCSARASRWCRRRRGCTWALEELFQGSKGPISAVKRAARCWVSTNQVKPGGQKCVCSRSVKRVHVFLNMDLEIYFQKGVVGPNSCGMSIAAFAQLPRWWKQGGGGRH